MSNPSGADHGEPGQAPGSDPAASASGYVRLPMPVVAGVLLAVIAALLALGLWANRALRPEAAPVPVSSLPPTAAVAPTAAPPPTVLVAAPTPAAAATATPVTPPTPTVQPTPLVGVPTQPAATAQPTPLPTVEPTLAAEVGQAYENFWRVKSQALLDLDTTNLPDVMDGQYLSDTQALIDELRQEGRAIKTQVSLNYTVVDVTSDSASVIDYFQDNSIYVAVGTEDPLTSPAADKLSVLYRLRKSSDVWKVYESVRSQ